MNQFAKPYVQNVFPYLLRKARELNISTNEITLLDIGCGWAPMAIAFVIYESTVCIGRRSHAKYLGIDIREDAIGWLQKAYSEYGSVRFQHHKANSDVDYIGAEQLRSQTISTSNGEETKFRIPQQFVHNLQWSSSVFTHLTPQACMGALRSIKDSCARKSMQANTWLIIDDESKYSLASGTADRKVPIDCGAFLTYSEANPLVCTCYKIGAIEKMYAETGLEIVHIDRGSWRGAAYKNAANHYQDIVISRPTAN